MSQKHEALVSVSGVGVLNLLTLRAGVRRGHRQTVPVHSHRRKNLPLSPLPDWMRTLTALWLCIPEGVWHGIKVSPARVCVGMCVCMSVCVCVCARHPLQGRVETPSVGVSEPLHGH